MQEQQSCKRRVSCPGTMSRPTVGFAMSSVILRGVDVDAATSREMSRGRSRAV